MSSPYPILDNRPIDQWKVTELKEELKRRKLMTKGLKEDLIKRLDEALRIERESSKKDVDNGFNSDPQTEVQDRDANNVPIVAETAQKIERMDNDAVKVDIDDSEAALGQGKVQVGEMSGRTDSFRAEDVLAVQATTVETSTTISESVISEISVSGQDVQKNETQENGDSTTLLENEDSKPQLEKQESEPRHEDVTHDTYVPTNQVSEVSPVLGFEVKSDSISTDSVSINEKIELKDNIIADNVKLELDVVKPEMVEPSSRNVVADGGESHPMDDEEPHENKVFVEEKDDDNSTNSDSSKKNDNAELGDSEKLNLDRSSGDDSMEEDALDIKQIGSKYSSEDVGDKKTEVPVEKEEVSVDIVGDDLSAVKKDVVVENKKIGAPAEKRKLHDQVVSNNEPSKRQRRWFSQSLKVPEPRSSTPMLSTTPKETFQPASLKRSFSRSDSNISEDAPKERVVPPSPKSPTNSLRIDRFLRPFTLKAVQELLGKTGSVTSFWMDHIKTHCYVTYSSVDEAIATRNAVYNLQWPSNGGRLLVAEFVNPQEVKMRVDTPPQTPAAPVSSGATAPPAIPTLQPQPSPRNKVSRQQLPPSPSSLPPPPPLSNPPPVRERLSLPPPPPLPEKPDPPIVTLDDLFQKTRATPRIYFLPLSEEQVAAKHAAQSGNTKQ